MIKFNCPSCDYRIAAPDGAGGQKGKCPKCKTAIAVPSPRPLKGAFLKTIDDDIQFANTTLKRPPVDNNTYSIKENTKSCPYCGEEILEIAKKCKHCGEFLDITMVRSSGRTAKSHTHGGKGKATASYVCALVGCVLGCLPLGIIAVILACIAKRNMRVSGNYDGQRKARMGLIFGIIAIVISTVAMVFIIREGGL